MFAIEQTKKMADEALAKLASSLEAGKSEALTAYLNFMGRFHRYSWGNVLLILSQMPEATRVAGYNAWRSLGRFVKKGEKGIVILAPMMVKPKEQPPSDGKTGVDGNAETKPILRFKAVYVFDVSQTEGQPLPDFARVGGNPAGHADRLKALIGEKGIALEYADSLGQAMGLSHGGRIQIRAGLSPAEEFSVLTHELAHELLHKGEARKGTSKRIRETQAEAVAFVVCHAIGLDTNTASSDYIQLYDGDKATLAYSLDVIQQTAAEILAAILPKEGRAAA